jgi:hypothetical protein
MSNQIHFEDVTVKAIGLDDPLIPEAEVAKILNVCVRTLQRRRRARKISCVMLGGKILYRLSHIKRYIEKCTLPAR